MFATQARHHVQHALRVPVRGIDHEHVHVCSDQRRRAITGVARNAHRRPHTQPAEVVLGRIRVLDLFLNIFDGDQTLELEIAIHDQQLFNFVAVQNFPGGVERGAHGHRDEILPRHHGGNRTIDVGFKS